MAHNEREITLGVLTSIQDNSFVTQRSMAGDLGIALGLTNFYLKRCVKKGLVKVQQIPANRYAYYLTPQGFSEKSRLAREYFTQGFKFFRVARQQFLEIFSICEAKDWKNLALHGLTDMAEIAVMCARDQAIELEAIIDPSSSINFYSNVPVLAEIPKACHFDAIIITDLGNPEEEFEKLSGLMGSERVFAPKMLNISPKTQFQKKMDPR